MLRLGSELVDDLLNMRLTERAASERLEQLDCPPGTARLLLARLEHEPQNHWQMELSRQNMKLLVRQAGNEPVILLTNPGACQPL
ncbi:hypothetical protein D3C84_579280 [compost metagenome]